MSKSNSRLLVIVIVLQGLTLAGQWLGQPSIVSPAQAQVTDPGRDRLQTIEELRGVNGRLEKLIGILQSGDLQVRVIQPDEAKSRAPAR